MEKLFVVLTTILSLNCCTSGDNQSVAEIDKLPPATHIGANKAGCLVNRKAFLTKGYFPAGPGLKCLYQDGHFVLGISQNKNDTIKSIGIFSSDIPLHNSIGTVHTLHDADSVYGTYTINSTAPPSPYHYTTNPTVTGELVITHHNAEQAIISGTFWFDAINSAGEIVTVRAGRFDMEY